jgi:hypothetical protein
MGLIGFDRFLKFIYLDIFGKDRFYWRFFVQIMYFLNVKKDSKKKKKCERK